MTKNYDTSVRDWFIVQLIDHKGEQVTEILWGIIDEDKKLRFSPGDYVCTSMIEQKEGDFIKTQNTMYKLTGPGVCEVKIPLHNFLLLRQGFSPDSLLISDINEDKC